jgi:hypothetical protein
MAFVAVLGPGGYAKRPFRPPLGKRFSLDRESYQFRFERQMENGATRTDPFWGRVIRWLAVALVFSAWLTETRGDAISDLTANYNKVDASLAVAIERGDLKDARNLLKLRNDLAKELAEKKSLQNSPASSTPAPTLKAPPVQSIIVVTPSPQVKEQSEQKRAPQGKRKVSNEHRDRYVNDQQKEESGARTKTSAEPKQTPSATPNAGDTDTSLERWMGPNFNNPR